jgi:hypothetical protein
MDQASRRAFLIPMPAVLRAKMPRPKPQTAADVRSLTATGLPMSSAGRIPQAHSVTTRHCKEQNMPIIKTRLALRRHNEKRKSRHPSEINRS